MSAASGPNRQSCPACGAPTEARYRPFCSRRCADLDLWRWLGGAYRVPTREQAPAPIDRVESDDDDGW